jgi:hypothetical protein
MIADNALRAANPANQVVLAGLYRRPARGMSMTRYLNALYRVKGLRRHFDFVGIHPYAATPREVITILNRVRRIMKAHGDPRTPLVITELGWTTGGQGWGQSRYRTTYAGQAARLRAVFRLLLKNRRALRLRRVDWFSWRDSADVGGYWNHQMGLFTTEGHPKPAWAALLRLTGGSGLAPIIELGLKPPPPPTPA